MKRFERFVGWVDRQIDENYPLFGATKLVALAPIFVSAILIVVLPHSLGLPLIFLAGAASAFLLVVICWRAYRIVRRRSKIGRVRPPEMTRNG